MVDGKSKVTGDSATVALLVHRSRFSRQEVLVTSSSGAGCELSSVNMHKGSQGCDVGRSLEPPLASVKLASSAILVPILRLPLLVSDASFLER
jgi:hypothetical protein